MQRVLWRFIVLALITLLVLSLAPSRSTADEILVAAAASLTDVMKETAQAYSAARKHRIVFTFGASNFLARQIAAGAPADIFFSADTAQMDFLAKAGRLEPGTRKNLLSNRLVLIARKDARLSLEAPRDLLRPEVKRIALADPAAVPAGVYAKSYLSGEGLWEPLRSKIIPVLDVRATLAAVESGSVDAGIVYKTDAAISSGVRIVFPVSIEKGPNIAYPIALIKDSKNKATARDFLAHLSGPQGKAIFTKHGFVVLDEPRHPAGAP
jgi:molybdate transport system substrate-binding protein